MGLEQCGREWKELVRLVVRNPQKRNILFNFRPTELTREFALRLIWDVEGARESDSGWKSVVNSEVGRVSSLARQVQGTGECL